MAHPSFPWQDEAISICLHKPQVYIDLSAWSPKYFPATLIQGDGADRDGVLPTWAYLLVLSSRP